ncbi:hypothetical protein [Streptomyces qinglanensis]|uniref:Uncharacterized protein n=1 Tax=Streptomyces qinglanensis TaxID=943816 RepID=A0A1H9NTY9_9ACTN|nr:hypothetical protein [Streptomyces qinglanensis]SER39446.1 hypothetical protein SAMN05421870_101667 [Streptomyces qinglanensis]
MNTSQHVKLRLGFFEGFEVVTGLLRDSGAHRIESRCFVLDRDMDPGQTTALVQLLEYSHRHVSHPVRVEAPTVNGAAYSAQSAEL